MFEPQAHMDSGNWGTEKLKEKEQWTEDKLCVYKFFFSFMIHSITSEWMIQIEEQITQTQTQVFIKNKEKRKKNVFRLTKNRFLDFWTNDLLLIQFNGIVKLIHWFTSAGSLWIISCERI